MKEENNIKINKIFSELCKCITEYSSSIDKIKSKKELEEYKKMQITNEELNKLNKLKDELLK